MIASFLIVLSMVISKGGAMRLSRAYQRAVARILQLLINRLQAIGDLDRAARLGQVKLRAVRRLHGVAL